MILFHPLQLESVQDWNFKYRMQFQSKLWLHTIFFKTNPQNGHIYRNGIMFPKLFSVIIFCAEFCKLSHLSCDLFQAEKKINIVTSWVNDKMRTIFTQIYNFDQLYFLWLSVIHPIKKWIVISNKFPRTVGSSLSLYDIQCTISYIIFWLLIWAEPKKLFWIECWKLHNLT